MKFDKYEIFIMYGKPSDTAKVSGEMASTS